MAKFDQKIEVLGAIRRDSNTRPRDHEVNVLSIELLPLSIELLPRTDVTVDRSFGSRCGFPQKFH